MNKQLPIVVFSILLLVPVGAQNAFADHSDQYSGTDGHCLDAPVPAVDYQNCNLSGVVLAGLDLTGADFTLADLTNADLSGAILTGTNLNCLNHPICDALVGGYLIDIDNASLFVAVIGTNPVITGLIGITLAGIAGQALWVIHRRKNSKNS